MQDGRRYNPWQHASLLDLRIVLRPLPGRLRGYYRHGPARVIVIDSQLTQTERRVTLCHELIHYERGDEPCASDWHESKQEAIVRELSARRLITLADLGDGLALYDHERDLAEYLWTDRSTVRIRVATLSAIERAELDARLGRVRHSA